MEVCILLFFSHIVWIKKMDLVSSLFNYNVLMFIQILMFVIQVSIEDEISSHLSHGFKVIISVYIGLTMMFNVMLFNNFTKCFSIHTLILWF